MTFKSKTQPYCRWCAKAIKKYVTTVSFVPEKKEQYHRDQPYWRYVEAPYPKTKQDAQKHTNQQIVSVKRKKDTEWNHAENKWNSEDVGISSFSEWDGQTYVNEFFCSRDCAEALGYAVAHEGRGSKKFFSKLQQEAAAKS